MFDVGADAAMIGSHLGGDPFLAPLVAARPGLRVPGSWDGFEAAVRAVLGQQVSLAAARRLAATLVELCGACIPESSGDAPVRLFPTAAELAAADLSQLPVPGARRVALLGMARAALRDPFLFEPADTLDATLTKLTEVRGVGDWTAHMIALRAAGEPDAFPDGDAGLLRAVARRKGRAVSRSQLLRMADRWRPWRAYAAQHLWAAALPPGRGEDG
jgi:AraC family transcriptional regulator of adaptative response / DNA-3-methyladenine glycosylase II